MVKITDFVVRRGGKQVCQRCGRSYGPAPLCDGDTHGICCDCQEKYERELGKKFKIKWPFSKR